MKSKRIVTFGELLLRFSKPGHKRFTQGEQLLGNFGGSEANVAISLATLGDEVEYVTRLPKGQVGLAATMMLREYGPADAVDQFMHRDQSGKNQHDP